MEDGLTQEHRMLALRTRIPICGTGSIKACEGTGFSSGLWKGPRKASAELLSEMWFNTVLSILTDFECKSGHDKFYMR